MHECNKHAIEIRCVVIYQRLTIYAIREGIPLTIRPSKKISQNTCIHMYLHMLN